MTLATTTAPAPAEPAIPTLEECARLLKLAAVAMAGDGRDDNGGDRKSEDAKSKPAPGAGIDSKEVGRQQQYLRAGRPA
jgi:hypothetical protein